MQLDNTLRGRNHASRKGWSCYDAIRKVKGASNETFRNIRLAMIGGEEVFFPIIAAMNNHSIIHCVAPYQKKLGTGRLEVPCIQLWILYTKARFGALVGIEPTYEG